MKIVLVITELRPAGAERIVAELAKGLLTKQHQVAVISLLSLPEKSNIVDELEEANIPIFSLQLTKNSPWKVFRLCKYLKSLAPDIVHTHLLHPNIISRLTYIKRSYRLINTVHIAEKRQGKQWHFLFDKWTYWRCDCMTVVSYAVASFHANKIGVDPKQLPVIYNGCSVETNLDPQLAAQAKVKWEMQQCSKIIGSVGRLDWQKGYDLLLQTLPTLSKSIPEGETWGIVILGEGPQRSELEQWQNKLAKNIKLNLPGFHPDAPKYISCFDLFVMPSRYEGFGLTLIEAMSHGVPIITSNADSLPELLEFYDNGQTADFTQIEQIVATMTTMCQRKKTKGTKRFTITEMVDKYNSLYREIKNNGKNP